MSEVTSVNGKTGEVVVKATDVEAIPASEAGEPGGVATLNGSGELPEAQLPSSVASGSALGATSLQQLPVHAVISTSVTLGGNEHSPVSVEAGALIEKLPTGKPLGTIVSIEKTDATANIVTISGNIRDVAESTITLKLQHETLLLEADASGSWWPLASHKTLSSLDTRYTLASTVNELGEVEGNVEPNIEGGKNVVVMTAKGNVTIKPPINAAKTAEIVELWLIQNSAGGHTFTFESSIATLGEKPTINTSPNAITVVQIVTKTGGTAWQLIGLQQGATGPEGPKGAEGSEINLLKPALPKKIRTYKSVSSSAIEERAACAETVEYGRGLISTSSPYQPTSGASIGSALVLPPKQKVLGLAFWVQGLESETPTRTHMCVALLDHTGKQLALSGDYTSTTNTPLLATRINALYFSEPYESSATEAILVYGLFWETMSAGKPITLAQREGTGAIEIEPALGITGTTGLTTPATLPATVTLASVLKRPYMALIV